ncbi:MAG: YidH family protein [Terriglobales bacterium]
MSIDGAHNQAIDDERVRDHLANERTYLAWIRTGVATMGLGVVIAKLKYMFGPNYPQSSGAIHAASIGLFFAFIGITTIVMAVLFFLQTQKEIRLRSYKSRKLFVLVLAGLMSMLGLLILWYLMQPTK